MDSNLCCLCFQYQDHVLNCTEEHKTNQTFASIIKQHFNFDINEYESVPKKVCESCWSTTEQFHEFFETFCVARDTFLKSTLSIPFIEVKTEFDVIKIEEDCAAEESTTFEISVCEQNEHDTEYLEGNLVNETSFCGSDSYQDESDEDNKEDELSSEAEQPSSPKAFNDEDQLITITLKALDEGKRFTEHMEELITNNFHLHCWICKEGVSSVREVRDHLRKVHNRRDHRFECKTCGKLYRFGKFMISHIQFHREGVQLKCNKCRSTFHSKLKMQKHLKECSIERKYQCDYCKKSYFLKAILESHILNVHLIKDSKYECEICQKKLKSKLSLTSHMKGVHRNERNQICEICAKEFKSILPFRRHMAKHYGEEEPTVQCEECGSMVSVYEIRQHRMRHRESKLNLRCPVCNKVLQTTSSLNKHLKMVHQKVKTKRIHQCTTCNKIFPRKSHLKEHVATHEGTDLYFCPYCPKGFRHASNKYKHFKKVHPEQRARDRAEEIKQGKEKALKLNGKSKKKN